MKKALIAMLLVLAIAFPMFAQGAVEEDNSPITLEFWTHEDAARAELEDKWIKEFQEIHPNVKVNVTRQSAEKLRELVQTAFASGEGPSFFNLPIENEYQYIEAGRVAPCDYKTLGFKDAADLLDHYQDGMIDAVVYDGDVYGLPLELTNWSIFINKNVFRAAGLDAETDYPKTWEDMVEVSSKIVLRDGDIITRRGFDFRYSYELTYFVPMVEQLGGELNEKEGCVNKEAWVKALTFMQNWGPQGLNLGNSSLTAARKLFNKNNGDIAMANTGLYQESRILTDNPDFYNSGEWMVVPYPVFEDAVKNVAGCYYGHFYMVNADKSEREQKMAWELIKYFLLTEGHAEEYLTKVGLIQPLKTLMNGETYQSMPYSDVFSGDFARSHIVYYGKGAAEIQSAIGSAVKSVMLQGTDPASAYDALQKNVLEILAD